MYKKIFCLLCVIMPIQALRNPFEILDTKTEYCIIETPPQKNIQEQILLTNNVDSSWQITKQADASVILKKQDGEIRHVQIAQE